jgi:hypothetical protein
MHTTDIQETVVVGLFLKSLNNFASVVRLAEIGACADAEALCRVGVETLFYLGACANDGNFAVDFVKSDQYSRLKLLRASQNTQSSLHSLFAQDQERFAKTIADLSEEVKADGIGESKAEDASRKAGLPELYDMCYRLLSQSVHPHPRGIARYFEWKDEKITAVICEPETEPLKRVLFTNLNNLLCALDAISVTFKLPGEKLDSFKQRYSAINEAELKV